MPKLKVPRKSTSVDMTAMCDVAFLLLSFFIFTAKMKKSSEVEIENATSVSVDSIPVNNKFNIYVNVGKNGEVLLGLENDTLMEEFAKDLKANIPECSGLTDDEIKAIGKRTSIGMDFKDVKPYFEKVAAGQTMNPQPGIPLPKEYLKKEADSSQLKKWFDVVTRYTFPKVYKEYADKRAGSKWEITGSKLPIIYVNAHKKALNTDVEKVLKAFSNINYDNFKLVTNPEDVPLGSILYENNKKKAKEEANKTK